jgi:type I restriction enzyme R subunit
LFTDADRVARRIRDDIAPKVAADPAYQNARKNTPNAARIEHDKALAKAMLILLKDDTQVYKQFVENESFRRFVTDMVYGLTQESENHSKPEIRIPKSEGMKIRREKPSP